MPAAANRLSGKCARLEQDRDIPNASACSNAEISRTIGKEDQRNAAVEGIAQRPEGCVLRLFI
jgi:hypothetical protein